MRSKIRTLAWRSRASRLLAHDLVGFGDKPSVSQMLPSKKPESPRDSRPCPYPADYWLAFATLPPMPASFRS